MKKKFDEQEMIAFRYRENLLSLIRDLENIDRLIPAESSRYGCLMNSKTQAEEMALIEGRKKDLLRYIQTVCRDHIIWSKKLLDAGWTPTHDKTQKRKKSQ
jgi:hypothetical protein